MGRRDASRGFEVRVGLGDSHEAGYGKIPRHLYASTTRLIATM